MKDSKIKVAICNRCREYVFVCDSSGIRTAVDPTPLDVERFRAALVAGKPVYRLETVAGRPVRVHALLATHRPTFGADSPAYVLGHGCGAAADAVRVVEAAENPPQAPVTPGRPRDGYHPRPALADAHRGAQAPSRADSAIPRRSDIWRCDRCKMLIKQGEAHVGVQVGHHRWARHTEKCA